MTGAMSEAGWISTEEERSHRFGGPGGMSVLTELELAEGDVLMYLERFGTTALRRLVRELDWPAGLVMMAIGALIREGLVRATRHELEVLLAGC